MLSSSPQYLKLLGHLPDTEVKDLASNPFIPISDELLKLTNERMCSHPDLPDPEIANANPDKLASDFKLDLEEAQGYVTAHDRMMKAANGQSWPAGCYDGEKSSHGHIHTGRHTVQFFVDYDTFNSRGPHYMETVTQRDLEWVKAAEVWRWSLEEIMDMWNGKKMLEVAVDLMVESYRLIGVSMIQVFTGPNGAHNIHIKCVPLAGSTIGVAWFNNGTCGDHVNHHIDSGWRPALAGIAGLLTHESGHNMNFQHTFSNQGSHRGVMSYSPPHANNRRQFYGFSTGKAPHVLPRDPALNQADRFYDTKPIPLAVGTEPTPTPPGEDDKPIVVGSFQDGGTTYTVTKLGQGGGGDIDWGA